MAEIALIDQELQRVALGLGIPPCPDILTALTAEMRRDEPDMAHIEQLISRDVSLAATLLKTVNSPFYGLSEKVSTVQQAIDHLGLAMLARTLSDLALKQITQAQQQPGMERFWDTSAKLAQMAAALAPHFGIDREAAYTYALVQNCGIPLLMQRFADYRQTLAQANQSPDHRFTDIEDAHHGINHATTGYLLTQSWYLTRAICLAIRHHHDYAVLAAPAGNLPTETLNLIALGILADHAVQTQFGQNFSHEWHKGGARALAYLGLDEIRWAQLRESLPPPNAS
ncbi:MAG: HDOD domain-containing protein [Sterolibacterium sp.]|jgi:HD-like signal output (HDOD) protein|nr:HDOD domain-containing protein [Sterolibacterium sp.]